MNEEILHQSFIHLIQAFLYKIN